MIENKGNKTNIKKEKIIKWFFAIFIIFNVIVFLRLPPYFGSFFDMAIFDTLFGFSRYFFYLYYILISFFYFLRNKKFFYFLIKKRTFGLLLLICTVACLIETIVYYHMNIENPKEPIDQSFGGLFKIVYTNVWNEVINKNPLWNNTLFSVPNFFWFLLLVVIKKYPIFIFYFLTISFLLLIIFMICFRKTSNKVFIFLKKITAKIIEISDFYWVVNYVNGLPKKINKKDESTGNLPVLSYRTKNNFIETTEGRHSLRNNDFVFKSNLLPYSYKFEVFKEYKNYKLDIFDNGVYDTYEPHNSIREHNRKEALKIINDLGSFFVFNQIDALFLDKEIGPSVIRMRFSFPNKNQLKSIFEFKNQLNSIFNTSDFEIYLRNDQLIFELPTSIREKFDLSKMIINMNYDFPLAVPVGFDSNFSLIQFSLSKNPVSLIAGGEKNSGRDEFVNQILLSLIIKNSPNNLRFLILSIANKEMYHLYEGIDHLLDRVTDNWNDTKAYMERILVEMKYRIKLLHNSNFFSVEEYNKTTASPLPRIIVVLDDYSDVLNYDSEFTYRFISAIKKHGQLLNISLILVTKEITNEIVKVTFIDLYFNLICFRLKTSNESKLLLNKQILNKLYNDGDFYYISDLKTFKLVRGQAASITKDNIRFIVNQVKKVKK